MPNFKLPSKKEISFVFASFSKKERAVFLGMLALFFFSALAIIQNVNKSFMVEIPLRGGSTSIGVIGVPRFVNPILATSEADLDLVSFIYSGLMRKNENGNLVPDLASKYEMSDNGLVYTFKLKDNLKFHDGKPITSDDVLFTVSKVKDSVLKSPRKINWEGITVEKIDEKTIKFTLKQPYSSFLDSATLPIMPAHLWNNSPIELNLANTEPVGSGPYFVDEVNKESSGIITSYSLLAFDKFSLGRPYIKNINLFFYPNEADLLKALTEGEVERISSITPQNAKILKEKNYQVRSVPLPRIFGLFFNQNQNQLFTDKAVLKAINEAIDKKKIMQEVLLGYGTVIDGPIPPNIAPFSVTATSKNAPREEVLQKIREDLGKSGWKMGEDGIFEKKTDKKKPATKLEFSISTGNVPELAQTAELIRKDLAGAGIKADIKTFETGNLNQNVIRPRKYDALLFGEIVNSESDLFAFWHSSQRKDPGLNVAMYTNAKADKILEDAFVTGDAKSRSEKYRQFAEEIKKDMPAVFLYSPDFIYVLSKNIRDFKVEHFISPSDLYHNIHLWYAKTEKVWKIFAR